MAGTSPAVTEYYTRLAADASHSRVKGACRWGNDISTRLVRCLFATAAKIDRAFLERLWTARWKPRITTTAATKRLQLHARGGCVFCLQLDGSVASGCPLTVGRAVLTQRVAYPSPDAQAASPVIPTVIVSATIVSAMARVAPSRRRPVRGLTRATDKASPRVAAEPGVREGH
jgi:hypothetical protein